MLEELISLDSHNIIFHFPLSRLLYIGVKSLVAQLRHISNQMRKAELLQRIEIVLKYLQGF